MGNKILKPWRQMLGRLLAKAAVFSMFSAMLLTAPSLKAQTTITTLGGGQPSQYYGYRDGNTLDSALFHTPCGLAIDNTGNYLFVADRDNNAVRVLQFDINYTAPLLTMTNHVTTTNLFNKPVGVALDAADNLFVLNKAKGTNGYILEFDYTSELIATNLSNITNAGGFALDANDNIYLTSSNKVLKVSSLNGAGSVVATITATNCLLQGITVKHNGLLAVCDAGRNGILLINPSNGTVTTNAGFHGIGDFITVSDFSYSNTARFFQPASVFETGNGTLIVSDYGNNRIKAVLPNGSVTNICGVSSNYWGGSYPGWYDHAVVIPDSVAPNAQERMPNGLAFAPDGSIYVSEDFYHTIRKISGAGLALTPPPPPSAPTILTVTTNYGQVSLTWSTVTGATNYNVKRSTFSGAEATIANTALTSYTDSTASNGVTYYYVVSALNSGGESTNSAEVTATPPLPPVPDPQIGYVVFPSSSTPVAYTSVFNSVSPSSADFYNDTTIVIKGTPNTDTYYTTDGSTPTNTSSSVLSDYQDGLTPAQVTSYEVNQVAPTLIVKALGAKKDGSPSSAVVQATFNFITGNPTINGNNASQFNISDITANAHLYYTTDGSDPSSTNGIDLGTVASPTNVWTVGFPIVSNTLFKVIAVRANYQPSAIKSAIFSPSNFVANQISFGFASGEASSTFIASPGQTFYAPVTLTLLPNTAMYSLQFNLTVTNVGPTPITPGAFGFQSMLMKPDPNNTGYYLQIPPYMYVNTNSTIITNTVYYDGSTNFVDLESANLVLNQLSVGWVERYSKTNLYNTILQDLVQYSQAHDDLFLQSGGKVIVGGYAFQVPLNATANDAYQIQIARPSATSDGIGAPGSAVYISALTNGSLSGGTINALKVVTIGQAKYIAGDAYPFGWFNAGDFGKGYLNNADVEQVFQSAIYSLNYPPAGSDFFDAMDSCGSLGTLDGQTGYYTNNYTSSLSADQLNALFDGNDTTINQIAFGDRQLDVCDVYVTFRRSLDSSLTWYRRFWTNGMRVADIVPNVVPKTLTKTTGDSSTIQSKAQNGSAVAPQVNFVAGDLIGSAGQTVQIPITASIFGKYPLRMLMLNLTVEPLDGSPALTAPVQFTQNATLLGTPFTTDSIGNGNYSAVWLNNTNAGLTGTVTIGTLTITIPSNATANSAYDVHFDHASATPNGFASFPKQIITGLITLSSRTNSSFNDGIPDSWRLRWFGTINNYLSASNACPTSDGINNWMKYVAGVDPNTANDFPSLNAKTPLPAGAVCAIHWPTVSGKQYVIKRSDSLFSSNWTAISTNTGTGADMEFDDTTGGKAQFYRVLILP